MSARTSRIVFALALLAGGASANKVINAPGGYANQGAGSIICNGDDCGYDITGLTCFQICMRGIWPYNGFANCAPGATRRCNPNQYTPSGFDYGNGQCSGGPHYNAATDVSCDSEATTTTTTTTTLAPVLLDDEPTSPTCSGCGLKTADVTNYNAWCSLPLGGTDPKVCNVQAPATQANIDTLAAENCDVIKGAMSMNSVQAGDRITDITSLGSIKVICGTLMMADTLVPDLDGLSNLRLVTGAVNIVAGSNTHLDAAGISSGFVNAQLAGGMLASGDGTPCGTTVTCAVDVATNATAASYTEMTTCGENGDETLHKYDDRAGCCEDMNDDDLDTFINSIDAANPALVAACAHHSF